MDRALGSSITALFTNMPILKFKSQLTIAFFAAVNHLNGPLRKQNFTLMGFKRSRFVICDWWISIRFVCLCVSRFVACVRNYETAAKNVIVNVHSEVLQI